MKLKSIKINNYKSIGETENILRFGDNTTTLIGKNESGKSNLLEAISYINLNGVINPNIFKNVNRITNNNVSLELRLYFTDEEKETIGNVPEETEIVISNGNMVINGGFKFLISRDTTIRKSINLLSHISEKLSLAVSDVENFQKNLNLLIKSLDMVMYNFKLFCDGIRKSLVNLDSIIKEEILDNVDNIQQRLEFYYSTLPIFYYRETDMMLGSSYSLDTIKRCINEKNNIMYSFLKAANILDDEILSVFDVNLNSCIKMDIKSKIQSKIKLNIEEKFNEFYKQETIQVSVDFNSNSLQIYINSNGKTMTFSERSNGLKWYFSLFVDMLANNLNNKVVIYLLDEPGVFLHVNAQKELLKFLDKLCDSNNQVIYTTQSPYMLDENDILNIRAIVKDNIGITKMYNSVYDSKLDKFSRKETLSPLLNVLGTDLKYNIGPAINKKNVIVEGVTDYMYIKAMLNYLNIDDNIQPYIIHSVGASNIDKIVSILLGWGYEFAVILDYDRDGYNASNLLQENFNLTLNKDIFFINCRVTNSSILKDDYETIESLISREDNEKLDIPYNKTDSSTKKLAAKSFFDKIKYNKIVLSKTTIKNFENLFKNIGVINI